MAVTVTEPADFVENNPDGSTTAMLLSLEAQRIAGTVTAWPSLRVTDADISIVCPFMIVGWGAAIAMLYVTGAGAVLFEPSEHPKPTIARANVAAVTRRLTAPSDRDDYLLMTHRAGSRGEATI